MKLSGLIFCGAIVCATICCAQENKQKSAEKILAFVPENVEQLAVYRPGQILNSPDMAKLKRAAGNRLDRYFNRLVNQYLKFGLAELKEIDALVNASWMERKDREGSQYWTAHSVLLLRTLEENSERFDLATHAVKSETEFKDKTIFEMKKPLEGRYHFSCILNEKTIAWSSRKESIEKVIESGSTGPRKADFYKAWTNFADSDISFLLKVNEEDLRYTPEPMKALKDVEFVVGGAELGEETAIEAIAFCRGEDEAKSIVELTETQLKVAALALDSQLKNDPNQEVTITMAKDLLKSFKIKHRRNQVSASAKLAVKFDEIAEPLNDMYAAQKKTEAMNNVRQQALAMLNFESAFGEFPKSVMVHPETGKEYSWRIAVLPYVERSDIYERYDFSQDWDSPHNLEVTAEMPDFFRSDMDDSETTNTSFFLLTGPGGAFGGEDPVKLMSFADGASNTIMAIEAKRDVHWSKPEDIEIDPNGELPDFGGFHEGGFNAVRVDGSVQFYPENVADDYLRLLFSPADGQIMPNTIPLKDGDKSEQQEK